MTRLRATFTALSSPNYRKYFAGHAVSLTGTWAQRVGQAWLVLELTGSGTLLGIAVALQFLPMLLAGPWGGLVADRVDKRRLLLRTQAVASALALVLGLLTLTGVVELWMVMVLAFALGVVAMLDVPARQSFVVEMVRPDQVANAVTLNNIIVNGARVVGPGVAGLVIATAGIAPSFLFNAASYLAMVLALWVMDPSQLHRNPPAKRARGQLREGWRYVRGTPELAGPLVLMAAVGMLAYESSVVLPLLARYSFGGDAQTFGTMNSAMGLGAVVGGLVVAGSLRPTTRSLMATSTVFGGMVVATALSPTFPVALVTLFAMGAASIAFLTTANSLLQLRAAPEMRGRVMALWSMAFMGTTPIGGPLVGWIAETAGPRVALGLGGSTAIVGGLLLWLYVRRHSAGPAGAASLPVATAAGGGSGRVGAVSRDRPHPRPLLRRRPRPRAAPAPSPSAGRRPRPRPGARRVP